MRPYPEKRRRRSVRLRDFDYATRGAYFVTVVSHRRLCLFGAIEGEDLRLSRLGQIVSSCWHAITRHFPSVALDEFVVMPNHVHGVLMITDERRGTACRARTEGFGTPVAGTLATIIRSFKSAATREINEARQTPGAHVWQRGYHEHVIRNEDELDRIRQYVAGNPANWGADDENPSLR